MGEVKRFRSYQNTRILASPVFFLIGLATIAAAILGLVRNRPHVQNTFDYYWNKQFLMTGLLSGRPLDDPLPLRSRDVVKLLIAHADKHCRRAVVYDPTRETDKIIRHDYGMTAAWDKALAADGSIVGLDGVQAVEIDANIYSLAQCLR